MAYFAPIKAKDVWEYIARTLTSAENITSDGNPIDQSKIAKLDATISSRMSNQYESKLPKLDKLDVAVSTRSSHSPADVWSYSVRKISRYKPSDTLRVSANTERNTHSTEYVKLKEIVLCGEGRVRVKFDMRSNHIYGIAYGVVYVNDEQAGEVHHTSKTSYQTFSDDIEVYSPSLVQLYARINIDDYACYIKNFRIYYDYTDTDIVIIN